MSNLTPVEAITREIDGLRYEVTTRTGNTRDNALLLAALELTKADAELQWHLTFLPQPNESRYEAWWIEHSRIIETIKAARANLYEALQR